MRKVLFLFTFFILTSSLFAQSWLWARQSTGTIYAEGTAVATDMHDNAYLTGWYNTAPGQPFIFDKDTLPNGFYILGYLVKYDSSGNFMWAVASKASNSINPGAIATDRHDNVYQTGYFNDTVFFDSHMIYSKYNYNNVFLVKYNASGNAVWATAPIAKSSVFNVGTSVATDAFNNVYLTGSFADTAIFGTDTLVFTSGASNTFLAKYDSNGKVLWAKAFGNNNMGGNGANAVTIDKNNCPIIVGSFADTVISFGPYTLIGNGAANVFLVKLDPTGKVLWAVSDKGTYIDAGISITADKDDYIYISGLYRSSQSIFGKDTLIKSNGPLFIAKYDSLGNEKWVRAGQWGYTPYSMATDICDDLFIVGECNYNNSLKIDNVTLNAPLNSSDPAFIIELDSAGGYLKGTLTNTGGDDWNGAALNSKNDLYFGGDIQMKAFFGDTIYITNGTENAFISKLGFGQPSCCKTINEVITGNTTILNGNSTTLSVSPSGESYIWNTGATTNSIIVTPSQTTTYSVIVKDSNGCPNTASLVVQETCGTIFIPNAFSPNKDGQNDVLYVRGNCINTMDFVVFDRWGNKVFESENQGTGWDGMYRGEPENTGTYVYYLKAVLNDGTLVNKKGTVTLVR